MAPNDKINKVVPRWNAKNLDAGYRYDPKQPYDPADYKRFKEARAARDQKQGAQEKDALRRTLKRVTRDMRDFLSGRPNRPLDWDGVSTCFADLQYDDERGVMVATFHRGGDITYEYPMDREEAIRWMEDSSAGGFFNREVRE